MNLERELLGQLGVLAPLPVDNDVFGGVLCLEMLAPPKMQDCLFGLPTISEFVWLFSYLDFLEPLETKECPASSQM